MDKGNAANVSHGDNSEHGEFVYFLWTASTVLSIAEFIVMDIPFQALNIFSQDANLQLIAWVSIICDIMVIGLLFFMRCCCNTQTMRCGNDLDYYPKRNLKFVISIGGRLSVGSMTAFKAYFAMVMALQATPESSFAVWMIVLNFYKAIKGVLSYMARFFTMVFIFHNYWQKKCVSLRESLLIKNELQKLFVWSFFKVGIKDEDKFVYVDENRATAEKIRLDNRTAYGKLYFGWTLMFSGSMLWGAMLLLSITFGE